MSFLRQWKISSITLDNKKEFPINYSQIKLINKQKSEQIMMMPP